MAPKMLREKVIKRRNRKVVKPGSHVAQTEAVPQSHETTLAGPKHADAAPPGASLAVAHGRRRLGRLLVLKRRRRAGSRMEVVQVRGRRLRRRQLQVHVAVAR